MTTPAASNRWYGGHVSGEGDRSARRRLLVVEDDARLGGALAQLLAASSFDAEIAQSGAAAERLLSRAEFDAALVDLGLPDLDGVELIGRIHAQRPDLPVLVISVVSLEARILAALRAGACGYLYKEDLGTRLVPAVEEALEGGAPLSRDVARKLVEHVRRGEDGAASDDPRATALTDRERAVLEALATGDRYEDVARSLEMSVNTVRSHVRSIYDKLDVTSKTEAVVVAKRLGLLSRRHG